MTDFLTGLIGPSTRPFDQAAWEARIEAKRVANQRRRELAVAVQDATVRASKEARRRPRDEKAPRQPREPRAPREAAPRAEQRPTIRSCAGTCGRMTRPASRSVADFPDTVVRASQDRCYACRDRAEAQPRTRRPLIRPCAGTCGRMTRPTSVGLAAAPDTVRREKGNLCQTCATGNPTRPTRGVDVDVDVLRALYLERNLSTREVGARLGISQQTVQRTLRVAGIPVRPAGPREGRHVPGPTNLKTRMDATGVTSAEVRAWARENDHTVPARGLISGRLVDMYLADTAGVPA